MRVCIFANNRVGWKITQYLRDCRSDEIVALVVHPEKRRRFGDEILAAAGLEADRVFDGSMLRDPATAEAIRATRPDIGVSGFFGHILGPEVLNLFEAGCINVHSGLLPWNRGSYTNVWSIVDRTPSGVTVHYMDEGVDTGDVISQLEVPIQATDTGETLYHRLETAAVELFAATWPVIHAGKAPRRSQDRGTGTGHRVHDVERIDRIDLDRQYTARELIDIIRARTFSGYRGAYFEQDGRKVYLSLQLTREDEPLP